MVRFLSLSRPRSRGLTYFCGLLLAGIALWISMPGPSSAQNASYEMVEVAEDVYSFGGGSMFLSFSMVVVTNEGVIIVDPVSSDHAANMMDEIRKVTAQPIKYVIYSHNHWDHISGGQIFKDAGATVVSHVACKENIQENPNVVAPDQTWAGDRFDLRLGGKRLELYYFGPNHGQGMTVVLLPENGVMFTADLVVPRRVGFMDLPDFSPKNWLRTLREMEELDFNIVLYAHDVAVGDRKDVVAQREYLEDLYQAVGEALQKGDMMLQTLSLPKYQDWAHYDEWLGMNGLRIMLEMVMGW